MNIQDVWVKEGCVMKPTKTISKMATAVRLVQYPDGRQVLQGGYAWTEGFSSGLSWMDLPVMMVDSSGQEVQDD